MSKQWICVLFIVLVIWLKPSHQHLYTIIGDIVTFILNLTSLQSYLVPSYPDQQFLLNSRNKFDFIIIGSSPSGAVLANRLTENSSISVLVLEAGEEASFATDIPLIAGALGPTKYSYGYKTEPQLDFCRGCQGRVLEWEHGKALGGSTVINFMIYVRGNRRDYDRWEAMGNPGWGYDDMLPLFKKVEDNHVKISDQNYRGKGGHVTVTDVAFRTKVSKVFVQASQEAGHSYVDYNGKEQLGTSFIQASTKNGKRVNAEKAYLHPVRKRRNLKIQTRSTATKILINPKTKTAYGVQYIHNGIKHEVFAKKEVILSAGALNSPQVLMLSGIGPKEDLESLDIPVIQDLPVGKKMYDHLNFPLIIYRVNESITFNTVPEVLNPSNYIEYPFGKGVFTSIGTVEAITYVKTNVSTDPDPLYPDVELLMVGASLADDGGVVFRKMFNIPPAIYDKIFKPLENKNAYQVTPVLLHPKSHGSIKLRSKNPLDSPLFFANFFSDPENHDIKTMIAGIREFQRINDSPAFKKVGAKIVDIPVPGCEHEQFDSDNYWECALRTVVGSYYHMVYTCKMGPANDKEAVVNHELKVHGLNRLRVVDTSVMPMTSAHNAAPGYVIGEKAAEIVKKFWKI